MDGKLDIKDFKVIVIIFTLFFLLSIGYVINSVIKEKAYDQVELYRKAIKLEDKKEMFDYVVETQQGNFITTTDLKPVENIKFPEMDMNANQNIISLERVEYKETYDMKTRTVTYTDSKGKSHSKTETYWEWVWHRIDTKKLISSGITIHDKNFKTNDFGLWYQDLDASKFISVANRSDYYTGPHHKFSYTAILGGKLTIFAKAVNGTIKPVEGGKIDVFEKKYQKVLSDVEKSPNTISIFFIVGWAIFTMGAITIEYIFLYDNYN